MMSVSAYLTVLAPEFAWIGWGHANIAAQMKRREASTAKREILESIGFLLTEWHSCFWNRLTEYAAGVFLRPLGNERRDSPARRRWPRQLRRTRAREFGGETLGGRGREIRLRRSLTALLPGSVPLQFRGGRHRNRSAFGSSFLSCQDLKSLLETVLLEGFGPFAVVKGIVRIKPVALRVHFQIRDLGDFMVLDEKLPLGNQRGNQVDFRFIQMKLVFVQLAIHVGVGEENLRGARFDNHVHDIRLPQFVE